MLLFVVLTSASDRSMSYEREIGTSLDVGSGRLANCVYDRFSINGDTAIVLLGIDKNKLLRISNCFSEQFEI
jgi:hypothetical protein